jgi:hypothetical protein
MVGVERESNPKKWNYSHFHTYPLMNALKERETEGLEQMRKTANEKQSMGRFYLLSLLKIVRMRARARVCISYFTICGGITYKKDLQYYAKLREMHLLHPRLGVL